MPLMRRLDTIDIFPTVRTILAKNLEVDADAIDLNFPFHYFIERLAARRHHQPGTSEARQVEVASIYQDLSEAFDVSFLIDLKHEKCVTVADLIVLIRSKLEDRI